MDDFVAQVAEITLLQLSNAHVFRIPPQRNAEGHRASDWPSTPAWSGSLKIVSRGDQAAIILSKDDNIFATSQIGPGSVERTIDSGRYFVLKIQNAEGKHAYIGLAFNERNDAFDFNVTLQEYESKSARDLNGGNADSETDIPLGDLSLKAGEKIKINFGKKSNKANDSIPADLLGSAGGPVKKLGGLGLPPPRSRRAPKAPTSNPNEDGGNTGSGTDDIMKMLSTPAPTTTTTTNDTSSVFDSSFGAAPPVPTSAPSIPIDDPFGLNTTTGTGTGTINSTTTASMPMSDPFSSFSSSPSSSSNIPIQSNPDPFGMLGVGNTGNTNGISATLPSPSQFNTTPGISTFTGVGSTTKKDDPFSGLASFS